MKAVMTLILLGVFGFLIPLYKRINPLGFTWYVVWCCLLMALWLCLILFADAIIG